MRFDRVFVRIALCAALCVTLVPMAAFAQNSGQAIQERMSAEEFKAAGLDKLSPAELTALNQWLSGTLKVETAKATAAAEATVKDKVQGFFDFTGKKESVKSKLVGEFTGFSQGRIYKLENGQEWQQTGSANLVARLSNPDVEMRPGAMNNWWMIVGKYNTRAPVRRIK